MEWIPFSVETYPQATLPLHPIDRAFRRLDYRSANGTFPLCACGFDRCLQNYFGMDFALGDIRLIQFHGGLN